MSKQTIENTESPNPPDLSQVTIADMFRELRARCTAYVCVYEIIGDDGHPAISHALYGSSLATEGAVHAMHARIVNSYTYSQDDEDE